LDPSSTNVINAIDASIAHSIDSSSNKGIYSPKHVCLPLNAIVIDFLLLGDNVLVVNRLGDISQSISFVLPLSVNTEFVEAFIASLVV
jgi:hypothetical protein